MTFKDRVKCMCCRRPPPPSSTLLFAPLRDRHVVAPPVPTKLHRKVTGTGLGSSWARRCYLGGYCSTVITPILILHCGGDCEIGACGDLFILH